VTGRFRRNLLPIYWSDLVATIKETLRLHLAHDDLTKYNAVQKILYIGVMCVGVVIVLSGLAIWKPVQFSELAALFGTFQTARLIHFLCSGTLRITDSTTTTPSSAPTMMKSQRTILATTASM